MFRWFFYEARSSHAAISESVAKFKERRRAGSYTESDIGYDEHRSRQQQFVEEQERIKRLYERREIQRRLRKAMFEVNYIYTLADNRPELVELVRNSNYKDSVEILINKIDSL